jgi:hypothetical protein
MITSIKSVLSGVSSTERNNTFVNSLFMTVSVLEDIIAQRDDLQLEVAHLKKELEEAKSNKPKKGFFK